MLFSCSNEKVNDSKSGNPKKETERNSNNVQSADVTNVKYSFEVNQDSLPYRGKLMQCVSWNDGRGKNKIIISHRPQYFWADENPSMGKFTNDPENEMELTEIFAYHYIWSDSLDKWKAYWTIHDYLFGCCDVYYDLVSLVKITDYDGDGKAESAFFYTIGKGTMSIDQYYRAKLIYHVNKTKLKVEGTTGRGKEFIESPDHDGIPVSEKYDGFTGEFEKYKKYAEWYWNNYHQFVLYHFGREMEEE
jgi:hypothetical protein